MALTLQEKLALSLTSYGSVAALARDLGVSARTVGRWLREGEEGGRAIRPEAAPAIDTVFEVHRDLVRSQAQADRIPYNHYRPIFLERRQLRTGEPGERVVGEHTEYIRSGLRLEIMADQQRSQKYLSASVRSVIDLQRYFRLDAEGNVKARYQVGRTAAQRAATSLSQFVAREKRERGKIIAKAEPFPLFTRYENISPQRAKDDMRGVVGVEKQLRSKHEPSTGQPGTVAADQYLFQLLPQRYADQLKAGKARSDGRGGDKRAPAVKSTDKSTAGKKAVKRAKPRAKSKR